jgi:hypothetical protein
VEAITISYICNTAFRKMYLKPDTVGIIPRGGYRMGTASVLRHFNGWRTLVGLGTMLLKPAIDGRFIWLGYQTCKLMGKVKR